MAAKSAAAVIGGDGAVLFHEHVDHVHPVHELVRQDAAGEIAVVAEVEILRRIPIAPADRTEIAVPVQIGGLFFHAGRRAHVRRYARGPELGVRIGAPECIGAAVEPPGAHQADLAQFAGAEVFVARLNVVRARTLLRAHLADALVHTRGADDLRPFLHAEGERLLHVHVLAGVEGIDRDRRVPVVRRRDHDRIQPGHLQQLAMVAEQLRSWAPTPGTVRRECDRRRRPR